MNPIKLKKLLEEVQSGALSVDGAIANLRSLPFADIGPAVVDHHRALRTGFPEVILGERKTPEQIAMIALEMAKGGGNVLVTRVEEDKAASVLARVPAMTHRPEARALTLEQQPFEDLGRGPVAVVTAGTSDIDVAEEASLTATLAGSRVIRMFDVGVAGIHRLFHRLEDLRSATAVVVVAGMEGALASVVGGLVAAPVIAVPTSVGYGASFGGVAALLGMLNSCSAGVTVVNIDNGFGAGYAAALINRRHEHGAAAPGELKK